MAETNLLNNNISVRDQLVNTAIKFLQNPKVATSPLQQKQEFLRKKGLTDEEIHRACEIARAGNTISVQSANEFTAINIPHSYRPLYQAQPSLLYKIKEILNIAALAGATFYCLYWFYKKFIEPFLFGRKKKDPPKDPVAELDQTIQRSMKEVKESISKVNGSMQKLTQNQSCDPSVPQLVQELKHDLASLKSLLLSRKQFPSAPASIPPWQLDATNQSQVKTTEREDDAGSGSSTNNSDSSLEMIREDPPKE